MRNSIILVLLLSVINLYGQSETFKIGLLKYNGGGDWYANLETSLPNLIKYCNQNLKMNIDEAQAVVEVGNADIFNYPLVHITGHGNIVFNQSEIDNLRNYLIGGGFLHISDNYGLDKFIRPQIKKVFPELDFVEIPFEHPIYNQTFKFSNGLPKIHEHNQKSPQGLGLFYEGRLICFYDFECDLGDGWESPEIHGDSKEAREKALQMGANIIQYVMMGEKTN
jgi:Domain of unknown function (DUF4159)